MKDSYLKKIIKEELKKVLSEQGLMPAGGSRRPMKAEDVDPNFVRWKLHPHVSVALDEILKSKCDDTICIQGHKATGPLIVDPDNPKVFVFPTNIVISIAEKEQ
jgi:hypothetical protein